jgi:hypothetical protein
MGPLSSPAVTARVVVVDDDDYVREVTEMVLARRDIPCGRRRTAWRASAGSRSNRGTC